MPNGWVDWEIIVDKTFVNPLSQSTEIVSTSSLLG